MKNSICKKVGSLLFLYIENKLDDEDRFYVEKHFQTCNDCYQKYLEMKKNKLGEQLIPFVNRLLLNLQDRDESIRLFALKICVSLSQYGSQQEIVQCIINSIDSII